MVVAAVGCVNELAPKLTLQQNFGGCQKIGGALTNLKPRKYIGTMYVPTYNKLGIYTYFLSP